MPFQIVRNDITNMRCDAIVNTANPRPVIGSGTDSAIHVKAGPQLLQARQQIGSIHPGHSAITPGYHLPARYVIHTVGPVWRGGLLGEARKLRSCYDSALALALEFGCESIAFPLISTGNYGFHKEKALSIAIQAFSDFLLEHEMDIYLVVFDQESFWLSEARHRGIVSYISEHYVAEAVREEYGAEPGRTYEAQRRRTEEAFSCGSALPELSTENYPAPGAPMPDIFPGAASPRVSIPLSRTAPAAAPSLADLLKEMDAGFSETLLKLIDRTGKKDSAIYTRANISRQHFSKIRNNPGYKPTKSTAIAFAIALELDLEETRDLIGRAGYALTRSSIFDVIVMYFIEQKNYNIHDINAALFEFDQSLLGM